MPRRYRLGERTAQMQATRERILEAAIDLYTEQGISRTTLRQVSLRADIAPGTLRNHFPGRDDLELAMIERLTAEAPLPDLSIFDGLQTIEARLDRLIHVTATFVDRARRLYRMWLREPMLSDPWLQAGAVYGARWEELTRMALGALADDKDARAVMRAVSEPSFFESIRAGQTDGHLASPGGRTVEQAAALISQVLSPWFAARAAAAESPASPLPDRSPRSVRRVPR